MPRVTQSQATAIVNYFRSVPLETAELVLDLAKDAVRERQHRSSAAKQRAKSGEANQPQPAAAAPIAASNGATKKVSKAKAKAKKGKKKGPRATNGTGLHLREGGRASAEDNDAATIGGRH